MRRGRQREQGQELRVLIGWDASIGPKKSTAPKPNLKDDLKRLADYVPLIDNQTVGNLGVRTSKLYSNITCSPPCSPAFQQDQKMYKM